MLKDDPLRSRPDVVDLDLPILMSGLASGASSFLGATDCAGFGGGGGGNGGGNGGGLGTSTLGDPPPPIHIVTSPFELRYILRPNVDQHDT